MRLSLMAGFGISWGASEPAVCPLAERIAPAVTPAIAAPSFRNRLRPNRFECIAHLRCNDFGLSLQRDSPHCQSWNENTSQRSEESVSYAKTIRSSHGSRE